VSLRFSGFGSSDLALERSAGGALDRVHHGAGDARLFLDGRPVLADELLEVAHAPVMRISASSATCGPTRRTYCSIASCPRLPGWLGLRRLRGERGHGARGGGALGLRLGERPLGELRRVPLERLAVLGLAAHAPVSLTCANVSSSPYR
jgi:hypothetical protein